MDFRVAPQAESDLDEIWYFLATQSSNIDVADRVIDSITARFAMGTAPAHHEDSLAHRFTSAS